MAASADHHRAPKPEHRQSTGQLCVVPPRPSSTPSSAVLKEEWGQFIETPAHSKAKHTQESQGDKNMSALTTTKPWPPSHHASPSTLLLQQLLPTHSPLPMPKPRGSWFPDHSQTLQAPAGMFSPERSPMLG